MYPVSETWLKWRTPTSLSLSSTIASNSTDKFHKIKTNVHFYVVGQLSGLLLRQKASHCLITAPSSMSSSDRSPVGHKRVACPNLVRVRPSETHVDTTTVPASVPDVRSSRDLEIVPLAIGLLSNSLKHGTSGFFANSKRMVAAAVRAVRVRGLGRGYFECYLPVATRRGLLL